jgi:hypothetical protein
MGNTVLACKALALAYLAHAHDALQSLRMHLRLRLLGDPW